MASKKLIYYIFIIPAALAFIFACLALLFPKISLSLILRDNELKINNNTNKPPLICTSFEYSNWSSCATDNTQSRTVTKASPEGCSGGYPVQFQNCKYEPLPQGTTGEKLYRRMIDQIKDAQNQTISTTYVAGPDGGNTASLTWQVKDDGLYLFVKGQRTSTPEDQSTMIQVDTNLDGQPDLISDRGSTFVAISPSDPYYKEIILSWAIFNTYFVNYLLK